MILESIPKELQNVKPTIKSLFYKGDLSLLDRDKVAIIGSRRPIQYTKQIVSTLSSKLSKNNITIVSGCAIGVDAIAHKAANKNTIAIMANSLDIKYPKINSNIIDYIYQNGLALSEYDEGIKATKYSFVLRNRLVVALSKALVVAQADINSGSMRSAEYAIKYNIPIYVLPHRIDDSLGSNQLIKEGKAKVIYDIDEFVESMMSNSNKTLYIEKVEEESNFLTFCKTNPTYEEAMAKDANALFEAELMGKITIINSKVVIL